MTTTRREKSINLAIAFAVIALAALAAIRFRFIATGEEPKVIASGRFHQVAHKGSGVATIYQLPDKKLLLRFTEFRTAVGQNLQVYLIAAPDAFENETVEKSEFISLGELQTSEGDQTYQLPEDLDLTLYRAVTIWSLKYRVNFTTAPLALNQGSEMNR